MTQTIVISGNFLLLGFLGHFTYEHGFPDTDNEAFLFVLAALIVPVINIIGVYQITTSRRLKDKINES